MALALQRKPLGHDFGKVRIQGDVPRSIQPKLAISQPGDKHEHEANRVAEQVTDQALSSAAPSNVQAVLSSPGRPLDSVTRSSMESRFGHNFGRVRIHTDAKAAETARAVNALAYTVGQDIVFGTGRYAPESSAGGRLLAHELAHVVQQALGPTAGNAPPEEIAVGRATDRSEQEADLAAEFAMLRLAPVSHVMREALPVLSPLPCVSLQRQNPGNEGGPSGPEEEDPLEHCYAPRPKGLFCPVTVLPVPGQYNCTERGKKCELSNCGEGNCPTPPTGYENTPLNQWCEYKCNPSGKAFMFYTRPYGQVVGPICDEQPRGGESERGPGESVKDPRSRCSLPRPEGLGFPLGIYTKPGEHNCTEQKSCDVVDCGEGSCPTPLPGIENVPYKAWCEYKCDPSGKAFYLTSALQDSLIGPICVD
jgi:Domain of unknown function (DUF4157)